MKYPNANKIKISVLIAILALLAVSSCEARTKLVDSWKNEEVSARKPEKIALIAVLPDALMREAFEIDTVKKLQKKGRTVVAGSNIPGLSGGIRGEINVDAAVESLEAAGVDGVIVMFYSGGGVSGTYARSDYWLRYEGSGVAYGGYGWGRPAFVSVYSVQQGPGYSDFQTSALVESSYHDLKTQQTLWRIVTETHDTEHSDAAKEIGRKIASEMSKSGL